MTVATATNRAQFNGSGNAGPFSFNFRFYLNSEISVLHVANDGTETLLVETSGYTLTGAGSYSGGSVTLQSALNSGEQLIIMRLVELLQATEIRNQGAFYPEIHEDAFDRLVMMIQQVAEMATRAIKMPATLPGNYTLPATDPVNKLVAFNSHGVLTFIDASYSVAVIQGAGNAPSAYYLDAAVGAVTVNLPPSGEVIIIKTDATANPVTILPTTGKTVLRQASVDVSTQDETMHLIMNGTNWYRI